VIIFFAWPQHMPERSAVALLESMTHRDPTSALNFMVLKEQLPLRARRQVLGGVGDGIVRGADNPGRSRRPIYVAVPDKGIVTQSFKLTW